MQRFLNHGKTEPCADENPANKWVVTEIHASPWPRQNGESSFVGGVASDIAPMKFRDGQKSKFATNSESVYSRIAY
jgi:hypothetical protein